MDVGQAAEAVAGMLAASGAGELGEAAGGSLAGGIVERLRKLFGADARSADALERTRAGEPGAPAELAQALAWYARRDEELARQVAGWAAQAPAGSVTQDVRAGRDAYVAGRDMTVTRGPRYSVDAAGAQGVQIGDGSTQHNNFRAG